ncbi:MAG TPA: LysE family translocator [Streptosporangiaceae bacterium]|jgi:threonine/homoserine/homoserine lactone efflux protein
MLPVGHLLAFSLFAFVLILVPGPNVMFVISRSLILGRAAGVGTAVGGQLGVYVQVVAVAFGVGALVQRSAVIFSVVKLAGAAYVVYLGVQAIRNRRSLAEALGAGVEKRTVRRLLGDGFLVGVTNPKAIVFFAAVLPQFVNRSAGGVPLQMLLLGIVFLLIAVVCDSSWALIAGSARAWFARSPRRFAFIGGAGGLAMIGLGASLAVTGRRD